MASNPVDNPLSSMSGIVDKITNLVVGEQKPQVDPKDEVFVGSIDQGTTSSRFLIFDKAGEPVAIHQEEFKQIYPAPGCVGWSDAFVLRFELITISANTNMTQKRSSHRCRDVSKALSSSSRETDTPARAFELWVSQTSARPQYAGTERPVKRCITQ